MEEAAATMLVLMAGYLHFTTVAVYERRRRRRDIHRRWWVRPVLRTRHIHGAYDTLFRDLKLADEEEFFGYTRMSVKQFQKLHRMVEPLLRKRSIRTPLPTELRLAATLSYLAQTDSVKSKAWQFRVGRSTMFVIIKETCKAIQDALKPIYLSTPSGSGWLKVAKGFQTTWNFPNCLGAVDGKHIRIKTPPGTLSPNNKQFFSLVMLAACDAKYRFLWVDIGDYGSQADAGIFSSSSFGKALESGTLDIPPPQLLPGTSKILPMSFIGDEAFPLHTYMMRPYAQKDLILDAEKIFNYRLSHARRVIDNVFGIVASRWRILTVPLCFKVETVENIVLAISCLHNYLMMTDDANSNGRVYNPPGLIDKESSNGEFAPGEWRQMNLTQVNFNKLGRVGDNVARGVAVEQRNELAAYFESPEGAVSWQMSKINEL